VCSAAADVRDHLAADIELDPEGGVRQRLHDAALNLDRFFLGLVHVPYVPQRMREKKSARGG